MNKPDAALVEIFLKELVSDDEYMRSAYGLEESWIRQGGCLLSLWIEGDKENFQFMCDKGPIGIRNTFAQWLRPVIELYGYVYNGRHGFDSQGYIDRVKQQRKIRKSIIKTNRSNSTFGIGI